MTFYEKQILQKFKKQGLIRFAELYIKHTDRIDFYLVERWGADKFWGEVYLPTKIFEYKKDAQEFLEKEGYKPIASFFYATDIKKAKSKN